MRTKPSDRGGVIGSSFRRSADLAAPAGRLVVGEVAVRDPEISLQLDGISRGQRDHGLQPDRGGERDMGGGDFAEGAADFGRSVQHQPPAHAGRGAGVDLVEQRRTEEVGAVNRGHEAVVGGVEGALIVVVGIVQADLRPGPDANVVVVVGVRLEPGQPGLVDDAGGVVDVEPVKEGTAVGRDREPEPVRTEQAHQRLGDEAGLQRQPEIVSGRLLVHGVEQIAVAALGDGLRRPERGVQLGRERVRRIRRRADTQQRHVLQQVRGGPDPGRAVVDQLQALVLNPCPPAGPGWQTQPRAVGPERDVQIPARPVARRARADDVAVAIGRTTRRRGQIPVEHRELDETVEDPQRLVVADMFLGLRRKDVGQQEMGGGVGHGMAFKRSA